MSLISEKEFERLSQKKNDLCISIFIPTYRGGKEVLEGQNQLQLKSQWQEIKDKLEKKGISSEKISKIEIPILNLINDKEFWRHQSDGLAVFASEGFFEHFTLPINFELYYYISEEFYLKPLAPMFSGDARFFLLAIQMDKVELFEASKYSIGKVEIDDLIPTKLEERVGYDYEEKHRKHKTQHNLSGQVTQHGYDAANRDRKNEFLRFFRAVDTGLNKLLNGQSVQLIVACQDYLFPIYKEANTYKNLYKEPIPGNPSDYRNKLALHSKAIEKLEPFFEKEKKEKIKQFQELNPERTSVQVTDIIPAIFQGKIDTLFLQNREDIWGRYDEDQMKVQIDEQQNTQNTSLMNLAAVRTIREGGSVYLIEGPFMPHKDSKMNAIFRYS